MLADASAGASNPANPKSLGALGAGALGVIYVEVGIGPSVDPLGTYVPVGSYDGVGNGVGKFVGSDKNGVDVD